MSNGAGCRLLVEHLAHLHISFGEEAGHVDLEVLGIGVIGRVGIVQEVLAKDDALGVLSMNHDTGCKVAGLREALVPNGHLVEVRTLVETQDAMFHNGLVVLDLNGGIGQFNGEAQGTIVENLVRLIAIRQQEVLAIHQGRSAAAQRGTHLIAIEAVAVVEMIGRGLLHLKGFVFLAGCLQSLNLRVVGEFGLIAAFHLEIGRVLQPHIDAESTLARTLQSRSVEAIGRAVVLPGNIVDTLGILTTGDIHLRGLRAARLNSKHSRSTRANSHIEQQATVVGQLIAHLLSECILHDERLALPNAQLLVDGSCIDFDNFLSLCLLIV